MLRYSIVLTFAVLLIIIAVPGLAIDVSSPSEVWWKDSATFEFDPETIPLIDEGKCYETTTSCEEKKEIVSSCSGHSKCKTWKEDNWGFYTKNICKDRFFLWDTWSECGNERQCWDEESCWNEEECKTDRKCETEKQCSTKRECKNVKEYYYKRECSNKCQWGWCWTPWCCSKKNVCSYVKKSRTVRKCEDKESCKDVKSCWNVENCWNERKCDTNRVCDDVYACHSRSGPRWKHTCEDELVFENRQVTKHERTYTECKDTTKDIGEQKSYSYSGKATIKNPSGSVIYTKNIEDSGSACYKYGNIPDSVGIGSWSKTITLDKKGSYKGEISLTTNSKSYYDYSTTKTKKEPIPKVDSISLCKEVKSSGCDQYASVSKSGSTYYVNGEIYRSKVIGLNAEIENLYRKDRAKGKVEVTIDRNSLKTYNIDTTSTGQQELSIIFSIDSPGQRRIRIKVTNTQNNEVTSSDLILKIGQYMEDETPDPYQPEDKEQPSDYNEDWSSFIDEVKIYSDEMSGAADYGSIEIRSTSAYVPPQPKNFLDGTVDTLTGYYDWFASAGDGANKYKTYQKERLFGFVGDIGDDLGKGRYGSALNKFVDGVGSALSYAAEVASENIPSLLVSFGIGLALGAAVAAGVTIGAPVLIAIGVIAAVGLAVRYLPKFKEIDETVTYEDITQESLTDDGKEAIEDVSYSLTSDGLHVAAGMTGSYVGHTGMTGLIRSRAITNVRGTKLVNKGDVQEIARYEQLKARYPSKAGYKVHKNIILKDKNNVPIGEIDELVIRNGKIIRIEEVKSGIGGLTKAKSQLTNIEKMISNNEIATIQHETLTSVEFAKLQLTSGSKFATVGPSGTAVANQFDEATVLTSQEISKLALEQGIK